MNLATFCHLVDSTLFHRRAHASSFHILQTGHASSVATLSWAALQRAYVTLSPSLFWLFLSETADVPGMPVRSTPLELSPSPYTGII